MILAGPPDPLAILIGSAISVAPFAGNFSRFATFSRAGLSAPLMIAPIDKPGELTG